jgi:hypothetical protein
MHREPPNFKIVFCSRSIGPPGSTFEVENEFETEFENIFGYETGAHMGSICAKNQR